METKASQYSKKGEKKREKGKNRRCVLTVYLMDGIELTIPTLVCCKMIGEHTLVFAAFESIVTTKGLSTYNIYKHT